MTAFWRWFQRLEIRLCETELRKLAKSVGLYIIHDTHAVVPAQAGMTWSFYYFSNPIFDDAALSSIM